MGGLFPRSTSCAARYDVRVFNWPQRQIVHRMTSRVGATPLAMVMAAAVRIENYIKSNTKFVIDFGKEN